MSDSVHLYIVELDVERASNLSQAFRGLRNVSVWKNYSEALVGSKGFDAMFLPLISAIEWGLVNVPAPVHTTSVVEMPAFEVAKGRPRYAIPGIALKAGEKLSDSESSLFILRESQRAMEQFNRKNPEKLSSVIVSSLSLGFDRISHAEAASILRQTFAKDEKKVPQSLRLSTRRYAAAGS